MARRTTSGVAAQQDHLGQILVVAPWLEGGGGQRALQGILATIPPEKVRLLVLFGDAAHAETLRPYVAELIAVRARRTPRGLFSARQAVLENALTASSIYSLMRGSHVVLGTLPRRALRRKLFAASFHQLPSQDSSGVRGRLEDVLVKRATRQAGLVTAPSQRAVLEIVRGKYSRPHVAKYEPNALSVDVNDAPLPNSEPLAEIKLLLAGRLSEQKGLDRIPELLSRLNVPTTLRVAGAGELEPLVRSWSGKSFGKGRVEYVGHVEDMRPHIDWSDAALIPSRWELNPMIVWEAWARGRPVFASRLPVFEDLEVQGPLFTFGSGDSLDSLVREELLPPTRRTQHMIAARAAVEHAQNERRFIAEFLQTG